LAHISSLSGILDSIGYRDSNSNFRGSGAQSGQEGCLLIVDAGQQTWTTIANMSNDDSKYEQANGKSKLGPAEFRGRLEEIMQDLGALLAQIEDEQHQEATRGPDMVNGAADRMLDVDEVAARLGFSKSYVYHRAKDWPFTRKLGPKALRFSEAGMERWLSSKGDAATTPIGAEYPELDDEPARGDVLELVPREPAA
jgi:predicted DNA-binding transcriptional regulator AlpA